MASLWHVLGSRGELVLAPPVVEEVALPAPVVEEVALRRRWSRRSLCAAVVEEVALRPSRDPVPVPSV
jgi:hypothetical protein